MKTSSKKWQKIRKIKGLRQFVTWYPRHVSENPGYIVPIPGTRKVSRLEENMKASEIKLTKDEVKAIDEMLDSIPMSQVFGGSKIQKK